MLLAQEVKLVVALHAVKKGYQDRIHMIVCARTFIEGKYYIMSHYVLQVNPIYMYVYLYIYMF